MVLFFNIVGLLLTKCLKHLRLEKGYMKMWFCNFALLYNQVMVILTFKSPQILESFD